MSRTFQTSQLFPEMTGLINVAVGRYAMGSSRPSLLRTLLLPFGRIAMEKEETTLETAAEWLRFAGLQQYAEILAKHLPYGMRRVLEMARALATEPAILLLDEPSAGMTEAERVTLRQFLEAVQARGVTLLLVSHDLDLVRDLADRVLVLDQGRVIFSGVHGDLRSDDRVVAAYLGNEVHRAAS